MLKRERMAFVLTMGALVAGLVGCRPKTTSQKAEDKIEDAGHEMGQGVERAGENIQRKSH